MYNKTIQRAKGPLLSLALLGGCVLALSPVDQADPAAQSGVNLAELFDAVRADVVDGWRRVAGPLEGDSYELYAALGAADSEAMRRYYEAQGSDELDRVFSYR